MVHIHVILSMIIRTVFMFHVTKTSSVWQSMFILEILCASCWDSGLCKIIPLYTYTCFKQRKIKMCKLINSDYLRAAVFPFLWVHVTCLVWYPICMSQYLFSCLFCLFRFLFFLINSRASGSRTAFSLSFSLSLFFPRFLACLTCLEWGTEHALQGPTLRLYRLSSATHGLDWQIWNSVRLGQADPPNCGGATTCRVRCWSPLPQVLEHSDQGANSATMQSCRHGMRHACSWRGFGSKYSQMTSSAGTPLDFWIQVMSLVWIPSSPLRHSRGFSWLRERTGRHWFQLPICQSYSSLCQSQTRKQLCWLSGRSCCLQFVGSVVQPSTWAHHTARVWMPPGPHSSPMHLPHGPGKQEKMLTLHT